MASHEARFDYPGAVEALVSANTPEYLLRKLRADPDVRALALRLSFANIEKALKKWASMPLNSISELVQLYVYLSCLAMIDPLPTASQLDGLMVPKVKWAERILNKLRTESAAHCIVIDIPYQAPTVRTESAVGHAVSGVGHAVSGMIILPEER